jgi:lipopolysaccharide export LptBFGC system permease protein LptF
VTLHLYVLRALLVSTLFAVGALGFVVFPAVAVSAVHKLGGVSLGAVLRYIPMIGVELLPYLVSLGFLLGVVSTFGRLAADREWIAIQMAGVHPLTLLLPGAVVALVLGSGMTWLVGTLSPRWKLEQDNFRANMIVQTLRNLAPGRTEFDIERFYLSGTRDGPAFTDVQIRVPGEEGQPDRALVADRVEIAFDDTFMYLDLWEVRSVEQDAAFNAFHLSIPVELARIFEPRNKDERRPKYRTSHRLRKDLADGSAPPELADEYRFEIHRRLALGATCLLFLLIGLPTGLWLRSGTQLGALGVASIYAFTYYILSLRLGKSLAESGALEPRIAAWSTCVLGLVVGVVLLWRLARR